MGFRKFPQQGQREGGVIAHEAGIWNDRQFFAHALGRQGGQLVVAAQCGKNHRAALAGAAQSRQFRAGLIDAVDNDVKIIGVFILQHTGADLGDIGGVEDENVVKK